MFAYSFASNSESIIAVRIVHGLAFGVNSTCGMALVVNVIPKEETGKGVGFYTLAMVASMAICPAIGIWIAETFNFKTLFLASFCLGFFALIISFAIKAQPITATPKNNIPLVKRIVCFPAVLPAAIIMFYAFANGAINTMLVLHADSRNIANAGIFFTAYAICLFVIRPLFGTLTDKIPSGYLLLLGGICLGVSMVLVAFANSSYILCVAGVLFGIGYGGASPVAQSLGITRSPSQSHGAASSTCYMGLDIGNAIGPIIASNIGLSNSTSSAFLIMLIPILMGVICIFAGKLFKKIQP